MSPQELNLADWSLVPKILKILESDFPHSLPACGYLKFYASCYTAVDAILLTPGGKVDKFGTFLVYSHEHNYGTFYSLNPDLKEMKSLLKSKTVPWDKTPIWGPIHEKLQPALEELYDEKKLKLLFPTFVGNAYLIEVDQAQKITYTCPPEVYLGPLKGEQGEFIDSFWPHRGGNSVEVTTFMIEKNGGIGLYLKESNDLIAWCLIWAHLGPGQLCVTDQHKRKGYGSLVVKAITKSLADKGVQPLLYIKNDNIASQELFKRIGYEKFFGVRWSSAGPQE